MSREVADDAEHIETHAVSVRPYRALAVVPTICLLAGIPFANRTEPYVLGLPFLLFWIVAWVVATSAIMGLIWVLDRSNA